MSENFPKGDGIFETIKTVRSVPFALGRHVQRATRSALILGMQIPSEEEIRLFVASVLANTPRDLEVGRLRLTFSKSGEFDLLHETHHRWTQPAKVIVIDRPIWEESPTVGMKTLPFEENLDALRIAREAGCDEGLRLNSKGIVSECAVSNVLFKVDGGWITPTLDTGCLPGITRGLVLEWLDVVEADLHRDDLAGVESMFLLSSLKDAQPVSHLENRSLEIDTSLTAELSNHMAGNIEP